MVRFLEVFVTVLRESEAHMIFLGGSRWLILLKIVDFWGVRNRYIWKFKTGSRNWGDELY